MDLMREEWEAWQTVVKQFAQYKPDILDMSKMTSEQIKESEEKFLARAYICQKCKSLHLTDENVEGKVCFPPMGDHHCDGILKKVVNLDEWKPKNENK